MQFEFTEIPKSTRFDHLTKEDLIAQNSLLEEELFLAFKEIYRLKNQNLTDDQLKLLMIEQLEGYRQDQYGASSERFKKPAVKEKRSDPPKPRIKSPTERYPNTPVREERIGFEAPPTCDACGESMVDSGMTEESEQLNVIPKSYEIVRWVRPKFRCSCHGCIKLPALPPRIIEGSSYSDDMIIDVVASKYCDLIPVERYVAMAARAGLHNLPPQSLIELTHAFADFVSAVYEMLKKQIKESRVLLADETPHKMLEGSSTRNWYLWGFSNPTVALFECHDTRSGDVASEIITDSKCEVLVSDVFSGYDRAIRVSNLARQEANKPLIKNANCNAHARRYFFKPRLGYPEANFYLDQYHEIYLLNAKAKDKDPTEVLEIRSQMRPFFEAMRLRALEEIIKYPRQNKYQKALNYYLENYTGLTLFLSDPQVPIDNNTQERLLRSHVVGRKTWYGTHSKRGALTAAILFSLIESCKLNKVNPRIYLKNLTKDLLADKKPYTPQEFKYFESS